MQSPVQFGVSTDCLPCNSLNVYFKQTTLAACEPAKITQKKKVIYRHETWIRFHLCEHVNCVRRAARTSPEERSHARSRGATKLRLTGRSYSTRRYQHHRSYECRTRIHMRHLTISARRAQGMNGRHSATCVLHIVNQLFQVCPRYRIKAYV